MINVSAITGLGFYMQDKTVDRMMPCTGSEGAMHDTGIWSCTQNNTSMNPVIIDSLQGKKGSWA